MTAATCVPLGRVTILVVFVELELVAALLVSLEIGFAPGFPVMLLMVPLTHKFLTRMKG